MLEVKYMECKIYTLWGEVIPHWNGQIKFNETSCDRINCNERTKKFSHIENYDFCDNCIFKNGKKHLLTELNKQGLIRLSPNDKRTLEEMTKNFIL